jgi:nucleotide-binding universal stress UspA family protein
MKILLAIDHSPASQAAIDEVAVRPWPSGSNVGVISVADSSTPWITSEVIEELARRTRDLVERAAERLASCGLTATSEVFSGDPKIVILDRAGEMGADLLVAGPHGAGDLARFLLGSVAKAIARLAPCSVELVREKAGHRNPASMKLLLATDGSDCSLAAVKSVAARPWPEGTEVRVLSAVEYHLPFLQATLEPSFINPSAMEKLREEAMRRAQDAIRTAEEPLAAAGLKTSEALSVLIESPAQAILDEAKQWGADLIVVGSHGHRGINRLLLGSISEAVAMHAECSVELIRPPVK